MNNDIVENESTSINSNRFAALMGRILLSAPMLLMGTQPSQVNALENVPRKPFAQWADVPQPGEWVVSPWYMESEAYHIWRGNQMENITYRNPEHYGIDLMQGMLSVEYGITERWAADATLGVTTTGTRSFNATGASESTLGMMDTSLGVRYQIFNEAKETNSWLPTLTFRASGILPGSYDRSFPFAPGNRSAAIEPSFLAKKHFGWQGFGMYGDALYRWNRTSGTDQYIVAAGFMQDIQRWTLNAGFRHLQCLSGEDIGGSGTTIIYSPEVKEISEAFEAGFNYRTAKRKINYAFNIRKTFAGRNTADSFWLGAFVDFPFGGKKAAE